MRGAPQVGFSSAIDRMRSRSSGVIFGRPGRRRERKRQYQRNRGPTEPGAMPAHDRLRLHHRQHARPFLPATPEAQPEKTIAKAQPGSRIFTLEDSDLLPEGNELQSEVISRAEENTEPREKKQKKPNHGPSLHDSLGGRQVRAALQPGTESHGARLETHSPSLSP